MTNYANSGRGLSLRPEARVLLEECAKSSDETIYVLPMIGRTPAIYTNGAFFPPEEDLQPRTAASWDAALKQLIDYGLITRIEGDMERYTLAVEGQP